MQYIEMSSHWKLAMKSTRLRGIRLKLKRSKEFGIEGELLFCSIIISGGILSGMVVTSFALLVVRL
jgi:hypothetical protein